VSGSAEVPRGTALPRARRIAIRRTLVGVAAGGVLLAALIGAGRSSRNGGARTGEDAAVRRGDLVMTVEVTGELAAERAIEIGPPPVRDLWDFKISFLVPESTVVKKGQPVIGFDTEPLEKSLEQKQAEYAEAAKQIERKEIDLALQLKAIDLTLADADARLGKARLKAEVPAGLKGRIEALQAAMDVEDAEKETANLRAKIEGTRTAGEAELRALRSRRDRARGRVDELQRDIESMRVKSPQNGIVIYTAGWRDEKKKVGDSTWVGDKVLEIPDLSSMKAKGDVDEADAGLVAVGQKVVLRLEAHPDLDYTGRVRSIGRSVRRQSWRVPLKVYKIEIALDSTDPVAMRPAMRFRGEIETARIPLVLLAPREAIFLRANGPVAWVLRSGRYVEIPVRLGRRNRQQVEILEGLAEGDRIATTDVRPPEPAKSSGPLAASMS